jgi:sphinganine-1-phosphate aldolase
VKQSLPLVLTLNNAKSALFYYVLFVQLVKARRHLRARGIIASAKDVYTWAAQVCLAGSITMHLALIL